MAAASSFLSNNPYGPLTSLKGELEDKDQIIRSLGRKIERLQARNQKLEQLHEKAAKAARTLLGSVSDLTKGELETKLRDITYFTGMVTAGQENLINEHNALIRDGALGKMRTEVIDLTIRLEKSEKENGKKKKRIAELEADLAAASARALKVEVDASSVPAPSLPPSPYEYAYLSRASSAAILQPRGNNATPRSTSAFSFDYASRYRPSSSSSSEPGKGEPIPRSASAAPQIHESLAASSLSARNKWTRRSASALSFDDAPQSNFPYGSRREFSEAEGSLALPLNPEEEGLEMGAGPAAFSEKKGEDEAELSAADSLSLSSKEKGDSNKAAVSAELT